MIEAHWLDRELARKYILVAGREPLAQRLASDEGKRTVVISENGTEENVELVQRKDGGMIRNRPWRLSVDAPRAALDVLVAGIGYLL